ncbi:MAG: hypothetical protein ABL962_12450 [Fimbriimonadaceae bacterium]
MPANNTHWLVHYWAGIYGNLGHLYGPARTENPMPHLPYALDNGAFGAFTQKREWDAEAFVKHVERYAFHALRPQWCVVPDVVADREATLAKWSQWAPVLMDRYHLSLALAVQDGMTIEDVIPLDPAPDIIFVGGSTEWKWETVPMWCASWSRVHVGRVNTGDALRICKKAGAESCDGTGWFRGRPEQIKQLGYFLCEQAGLADEKDVDYMVRHSRLKGTDQKVLPLEAA